MPEKKEQPPKENQKPTNIPENLPDPRECVKPMGEMATPNTTPVSG
ncbi:MAG: hypothetical protein ACTTH7_09795 [Treponema sp.]